MRNQKYSKEVSDYFELLDAEGKTISINKEDNPFEMSLPKFYDETKFKRAQQYYASNIFAMASGNALGTMAVFAIPSILDMLVFTKNSSVPKTAYKRYVETLLHLVTWYQHDLKPGSKSWRSLEAVRRHHVHSSRTAEKQNAGKIHQKDLVLTQMGLIVYILMRPEQLGIQVSRANFEAYVHFWRVIGHMIGIEDRFNGCTDSYATTRPRLEYALNEVFKPALENPPEHYYAMTYAGLDGLWHYNPMLNAPSFIYILRLMSNCSGYVYFESDLKMVDSDLDECRQNVESLKWFDRFMLFYLITVHSYLLNFWILRCYFNFMIYFFYHLNEYLPLLAMYNFGFKWAYVSISKESKLQSS